MTTTTTTTSTAAASSAAPGAIVPLTPSQAKAGLAALTAAFGSAVGGITTQAKAQAVWAKVPNAFGALAAAGYTLHVLPQFATPTGSPKTVATKGTLAKGYATFAQLASFNGKQLHIALANWGKTYKCSAPQLAGGKPQRVACTAIHGEIAFCLGVSSKNTRKGIAGMFIHLHAPTG